MQELILASTSPRRRQLLEQAGYNFRTSSIKVSEIPKKNLNLAGQVQDLARQKSLAHRQSVKGIESQDFFSISADTVVVFDNQFLGKPRDINENRDFLMLMSGQKHQVMTGVCLYDSVSNREIVFHEATIVEFRLLSESEILEYVNSGDGLDKAGGYGIQGKAGAFVEKFHGSMTNVVGFPVEKFEKVIFENGWKLPKREL